MPHLVCDKNLKYNENVNRFLAVNTFVIKVTKFQNTLSEEFELKAFTFLGDKTNIISFETFKTKI